MRVNKCLYQDMVVHIAEKMDDPGWKGYLFGWVNDCGHPHYLIQPIIEDGKPILVPVGDVYMWPAKDQEGLPEGAEPSSVLIDFPKA